MVMWSTNRSEENANARSLAPEGSWNWLFLRGKWIPRGARKIIHDNSPSTGEVIAEIPAATKEDVDQAFEVASHAQKEWAARLPQERAKVILKAVDKLRSYQNEVTNLLIDESGSTLVKARFEIAHATIPMMEEAATFPYRIHGSQLPSLARGKENFVKRIPVGVVVVISPWNYPLHLSMRAVAPALALGNAVVLKPSSETPITGGLLLARLFELAELPLGLLNVVPGRGSEIGDYVASHPKARVVAFTGSTEVGSRVAGLAAHSLARPAMELGGNSPHIVLGDADLQQAIDAGIFGSFLHQGQICIRINRILVHESLHDEYVRRFAKRAAELSVGDPHDERTVIGPVINEEQRNKILEYIRDSVKLGAKIETGGGYHNLFIEPTVLSSVTNDMPVAANETFGPVAPILRFSSDEEAIKIANGTRYGLAASVHSRDLKRALEIADALDVGMVHVNDQPINEERHVPFGGMKASGMGRYNGEAILDELTEPKWISIQHKPRKYPF
jgi:aldehyde dehydrogenase (NAD+)